MKSDTFKGLLFAFCGVIGTAFNFVTAKYGLKGFNPGSFSLVWTVSAAVYGLIIVILRGHLRSLRLERRLVGVVLILGAATGATMIFSWAGLSRLDPSFAAFIWRFSPVLTITLGIFLLKERIRAIEIIPIAVMLIGGCLSTLGRWEIVGLGVVLTLLACAGANVQLLVAKARIKEMPATVFTFYRNLIGAAVIALWIFPTGQADFSAAAGSHWAVTIIGALLGPCLGMLATFKSYQYLSLSYSAIARITQPLFVLPLAFIFLGAFPAAKELTGGLIILIGGFWLSMLHYGRRKKEKGIVGV